jgi:Bacterial Ig-like domain (group 3)
MRKVSILRYGVIAACSICIVPVIVAQNSIRLFDPVNVRASADGTGFGSSAVTFNSATLNLNCSASPITAMLSSSADNTGNVLADNNVQISVTSGTAVTGPVNVCRGGTVDSTPNGPSQNCFTTSYQQAASAGGLTGQDPDTFVSTGGVTPIDISRYILPGTVQVKIDLVDTGSFLASSTLYLNTNCSQNGVTGPATITGNPIPQTNPTPAQLTQNFAFNPTTNQKVQFVYDLSEAQAAGSLTITPATIPGTDDLPIAPAVFQTLSANTSFATSACLIHTGELVNDLPACKLFTLECTVGTGTNKSGAQCPVSSLPNEIFQDVFDGPPFTLPDISTPNGPTFHTGIGFLMASEGWGTGETPVGGPCTFDPASGLQNLPCPQNLLSTFSGPGTFAATGKTSHPNSTFIPVAQIPEDLTTVTVAGLHPGGWINNSTPSVTLSSQPPALAGTNLPGLANFVPAPIQSITYGISAADNVPSPGTPISTDTVVENSIPCPAPTNPSDPAAAPFSTGSQTLNELADGSYLIHYFAQDCAGTEELKFSQDASGSWSTNFYTFPINIDTVAPAVATGPVLSPAAGSSGSYAVGQAVTATYSCTDDRSGVVRCGSSTFSPTGTVLNTGPISSAVDTATPGSKTFTVMVVDAAGNQSSASVNYVVTSFDTAISLTLSPTTVTFPLGTNVTISVAPAHGHVPTGSVQLFDGTKLLQTSRLQGNGAAYLFIQGLAAGTHSLSVVYAGDAFNPGGTSAPATLTVKPVPVNLTAACWNANFPFGADYHCGVFASSNAGAPQGVITYQYDGASAVTLPLQGGSAQFVLPRPPTGTHKVLINYAAQTNYAAATPVNESFTVTAAPVIIQLTPSTWYLTGGNLTLTASIQSWSAGPPNQIGNVAFYDGSRLIATVPVNASGIAATTVAASTLSNGGHTILANYSGGTNYSAGSSSIAITVAR